MKDHSDDEWADERRRILRFHGWMSLGGTGYVALLCLTIFAITRIWDYFTFGCFMALVCVLGWIIQRWQILRHAQSAEALAEWAMKQPHCPQYVEPQIARKEARRRILVLALAAIAGWLAIAVGAFFIATRA